MICTESRQRCRLSVRFGHVFPLLDSIFRLCLTSLRSHASEPRTRRASKFVPSTAFIQRRKVSSTRRSISSTSIPRHVLIVDFALTSVRCRQSFQRTICLLSGTSTSRSTQTGSKRKKSDNFFGAPQATLMRRRRREPNDYSASGEGLLTPLSVSGFSVQSCTLPPRFNSDGIVLR